MSLGPIELLVIQFPAGKVSPAITQAVRELVDKNIIHVIDLLFVRKDQDGTITTIEMGELDDDVIAQFEPTITNAIGLLTKDDALQLSKLLEKNTFAGLMLFENTWETQFSNAIKQAQGKVLLNEHIPQSIIEQATVTASGR
jgi:hypothetical protein